MKSCTVSRLGAFTSTRVPNVHVVGDASIAHDVPKSGSSANAQGKAAAAAIAANLAGKPAPALFCYSPVKPGYGISVTDVYRVSADGRIAATPNAGGVSVRTPTALRERKLEALFATGWCRNITGDIWG